MARVDCPVEVWRLLGALASGEWRWGRLALLQLLLPPPPARPRPNYRRFRSISMNFNILMELLASLSWTAGGV